jgi:hypothetical protein
MDTVKRVCDLDPGDRTFVERVFGQDLAESPDALLILRANGEPASKTPSTDDDEVPAWCNVLEGMSDEDLADFDAILKTPIQLTHPTM